MPTLGAHPPGADPLPALGRDRPSALHPRRSLARRAETPAPRYRLPRSGRSRAVMQRLGATILPYTEVATIDRAYILGEIRRTAAENGGKALGRAAFARQTGIREYDWAGYWARWGDAVREAGMEADSLRQRVPDDDLLAVLATETRRLARVPTNAELRLRHRQDRGFPSHGVWTRWRRAELLDRLAAYCKAIPDLGDVGAIVAATARPAERPAPERRASAAALGQVYLIRSGRYFKIGRTAAFARRMRELDTALAEGRQAVHIIATDDPAGIEAYWHNRFRDRRRGDTEWFDLTADDVAAFRRRKFM